MRRALFGLLLLFGLSCGPGSDSPRLPMGVDIQGLTAADVGAIQFTVLTNGSSYLCGDLTASCLRSKVVKPDGSFISDVVKLKDDSGQEHNALRFKVADGTQLLTPSGQTFELHMPEGTNLMVVVEVLSPDAKLMANGCGIVAQVSKGDNTPLVVVTNALPAPPDCDPRID
jgi:hypothetical protein